MQRRRAGAQLAPPSWADRTSLQTADRNRAVNVPADSPPPGRRLFQLSLFFAAIYFVQGMAEPGAGLASQPIFFL
jgi:hypothetical protein